MRLIDADALLEKIWEQRHEHPNAYQLSNYAELLACEAPTIDAVEVVRCKDCKHAGSCEMVFFSGHIPCGLRMKPAPVKPEDFCNYGERKNNETD